VAGFSTQMQVPRDLQSIVIRVDVGGANQFDRTYPVYDGTVRLPRTLGVYKNSDVVGAPVTVTVYGYSVPETDPTYYAFAGDPNAPPTVGTGEQPISKGGGARILRASRQPYVDGQILYLPMPLRYSCFDVDCGPNATASDPTLANICNDPNNPCTCKGGVCVAPDTDPTTLPPYSDDLIYGSTNTCFRPFSDVDSTGKTLPGCMDYAIPPQVIDAQNCIFALPGTASVPADAGTYDPNVPPPFVQAADMGGGLNVRAVFDNVESEVLDYEGACPPAGSTTGGPVEGYCAFGDAPQKFQLAPGLCAMYRQDAKAPHVITLLESSATCLPKTEYQPICDDSVQGPPQPTLPDGGVASNAYCNVSYSLTPAESALYILFDTSSGMSEFLGRTGAAQALSLSLQDPVFERTQVAMSFFPRTQNDCNSTSNSFTTNADVAFEPAFTAQADIANKIIDQGPGDGGVEGLPSGAAPSYLEAALQGAYTALANAQSPSGFNRKAVMLFTDRDVKVSPQQDDCAGATPNADIVSTNFFNSNGIETYVVYLANRDYLDAGGVAPGASDYANISHGLATCGGAKYFFDASGQSNATQVAGDALASVVADMGGCEYLPSIRVGARSLTVGSDWSLSFEDQSGVAPNTYKTVSVANASSCTNDSDTNPQWVYDDQHIRICEHTCQRLVNSIKGNQTYAAAVTQQTGITHPATGIPVQVTAPPIDCDAGAPVTDAAVVESGTAPSDWACGATGGDGGTGGIGSDAGDGTVDSGP
jgi:hypothetical protein